MDDDAQVEATKARLQFDCLLSMRLGTLFGLMLGASAIYIAWCSAPEGQDRYLNLAILAAGAAFGWLLGTFLSPGTTTETKRFGAVAQAISAFLSGYLLAKLGKVIDELVDPDRVLNGFNQLIGTRIAFFIIALIATMLPTYVLRVYLFEWPVYLNDLFTKPATTPEPSKEDTKDT